MRNLLFIFESHIVHKFSSSNGYWCFLTQNCSEFKGMQICRVIIIYCLFIMFLHVLSFLHYKSVPVTSHHLFLHCGAIWGATNSVWYVWY